MSGVLPTAAPSAVPTEAHHWTVGGVSFASDALLILEDLDEGKHEVALRVSQRDAPLREFSEVTKVTLTVLWYGVS